MKIVALAMSALVLAGLGSFAGVSEASAAPYFLRHHHPISPGNRAHAEKRRMQELSRIYNKQLSGALSTIKMPSF